jgi:hypothetical protein
MKLTARVQRDPSAPDRPTVGLWLHNPVATPDATIQVSHLYNARSREATATLLASRLDGLDLTESTPTILPASIHDKTTEVLLAEYRHWDGRIKQAASWGAILAAAGEFRDEVAAELRRRDVPLSEEKP